MFVAFVHTCVWQLATHYIDCATLQQKFGRIHDLLSHVTAAAKAAAATSPSLLIIDSLDILCPHVDDTDMNTLMAMGLLLDQSRLVADHLLYVANECKKGGVKIMFVSAPEMVSKFLLDHSRAVTVDLSASYDGGERLELLVKMLGDLVLPKELRNELSNKTESFLPRDVRRIADRLVFNHAQRMLKMKEEGEDSEVSREDVVLAFEDYTPISMSKSKLNKQQRVSWEHVGGLFEAKKRLIELFRNPLKFKKIFSNSPIRLPKGCLLHGPSGCGKTMLGSAIASEAGLNMISVKGPELLDKYIGASEAAVRDVWKRAEAASPCLIFFDEFESLAAKRGKDSTGVTDRVVNQLLTFLDGVEVSKGEIFVLAATSRMDMIDPALLRPGRLDVKIRVGLPDRDEKIDILRKVVDRAGVGIEEGLVESVELEEMLEGGKRWNAADISSIVNGAFLKGVHELLGECGGGEGGGRRGGRRSRSLRLILKRRSRRPSPASRAQALRWGKGGFPTGWVQERAEGGWRAG